MIFAGPDFVRVNLGSLPRIIFRVHPEFFSGAGALPPRIGFGVNSATIAFCKNSWPGPDFRNCSRFRATEELERAKGIEPS